MGYGPYGPYNPYGPRPEVPQWVKDAAGKVEEFASWLGVRLGEAWDYLWGVPQRTRRPGRTQPGT
ncbi:hypothetical protein GCM10023317_71850 [Actinopolymorpha pittospori]